MCLGLGELVAVAIEMDELPACGLPIEAGEGAVYGMAKGQIRVWLPVSMSAQSDVLSAVFDHGI